MNKGSIVERLCSDLDRKEPRYKCATLSIVSELSVSEMKPNLVDKTCELLK